MLVRFKERARARKKEREKARGENGQKFSTVSVPQCSLCKVTEYSPVKYYLYYVTTPS